MIRGALQVIACTTQHTWPHSCVYTTAVRTDCILCWGGLGATWCLGSGLWQSLMWNKYTTHWMPCYCAFYFLVQHTFWSANSTTFAPHQGRGSSKGIPFYGICMHEWGHVCFVVSVISYVLHASMRPCTFEWLATSYIHERSDWVWLIN